MSIEVQEFQTRRQRLCINMREGIAIIPTAPEVLRNRDSHYLYRFDSDFYYLTGFTEPEAVLVLVAGSSTKSLLFCRDRNPERELWDGQRLGVGAAPAAVGVDLAYPMSAFEQEILPLLGKAETLFFALGAQPNWDTRISTLLAGLSMGARNGQRAPRQIVDIRPLLAEMRLLKSAGEVALMRASAQIAATAHNHALTFTRPEQFEYEVEAEFLRLFRSQGAQAPAYTPIVAGGGNACTLHYTRNDARLRDGDLLLIDAGCELDGYASDITRTYPVNGKFNPAQRDCYQLVLEAQQAAIAAVRVGATWNAPHLAAVRVLVQGFIDLGLCQGSVDSVIEAGDYRQFYMHRTGHWLGLDVHDVGAYQHADDAWCILEAGMVLTVEPGCYIRPADNVPSHFWHIGIRIEDDVLVCMEGADVLSDAAIKGVVAVEAAMQA